MVKKNGKTGTSVSAEKSKRRKTRSKAKSQGLIILPAIKTSKSEKQSAVKSPASPKLAKKPTACSTVSPASVDQKHPPEPAQRASNDYLPEYRSQTNGLKELLSSIDPQDRAFHARELFPESNLIETPMHIPHSRPGIPGSPDLPIGPTRWGLYLGGSIGALAFVFVAALAYSHIISPTGIDWTKVANRTSDTYQWVVASFEPKPGESDQNQQSDPISAFSVTTATASRISTTAATPKKGSIKAPSASDIFISAEELENQIKALEGSAANKPKRTAKPRLTAPKKTRLASLDLAEFDQLVVIPAANIDPDMEKQIFKRASSYLKQRDISSARMILQYAAGLGSGISAMALAETFDPHYLDKINLQDVSGSRKDARKWYYMAARLGIDEANARLTALK